MSLEELVKKVTAKDLKAEAKKRDIKLGRCPTKMDIAKKLPLEVLEELASKKE
ncbi:MAG: hypothetical protein SCAL_000156 [Candidatus Syntrophoarchaeum caldarius]|uniref:Uncharacterized protein n=1 Tax=Candidatus Syntropharchaeum caldarium TaxID=1838285 RepID=A0A1F2PAP5_9EURY|nr:MAG: hypothetical protein SCAL_000156 [Candidatus Syntrophoarchaeum caldarius]